MSQIIKLPHLEELLLDLANKIRTKHSQLVTSVTFDPNTNIVTVERDGGATTTFSLDKFIDTWGDLDCVTEYPYANLFDYTARVNNKKYEPDGSIVDDTGNSSLVIDILGGNEYSIYRKHDDNHNVVFYDAADQFVGADTNYSLIGSGWHKKVVTAPVDATKMAINFRKDGQSSPEMMVIKGNVIDIITTHIPYLDGGRILIGDCVSLSFNNEGTTLASTTHTSAIKELAEKIVNVANESIVTIDGQKPDIQGNVDLTFEKIGNEAVLFVNTHEVGRVDLTQILRAEDILYDASNTGLAFQNVQEVLDYLEKDKASLNKDNIFIGHNTFNEVNLIGKAPIVKTATNLQAGDGHASNTYCGIRTVSTHHDNTGDPRFVSAIKIRVDDRFAIGDIIDGIYVTEITKNTSTLDDIVGETISSNGSFIVEKDNDYPQCIYVPVQKEYTGDTYFIIGKKGDRALSECRYSGATNLAQCVNSLNIDALPLQGSPLNRPQGNGWIIMHTLVTNDINVREELSSLNDRVNTLTNGTVTSVNNEQPVDGNVTINAGHIEYNNATSHLVSTNVQNAIDELKREMTLLDSSSIFIVPDNTELNNLLGQNTLKSGDLIYIIDSTGVVDFTGQGVNNGNNPIAMIYDDAVGGNKLRIFSKFDSPINISADTVAYNDQTTLLGTDNVQGAIEKLKEKVEDSVTNVVYDTNKTLTVTKNGQPTQYDLTPLIGITSINREVGVDGAIELTTNNTVNSTEFKVGNTTYATLNYMTDAQADAIINNWN